MDGVRKAKSDEDTQRISKRDVQRSKGIDKDTNRNYKGSESDQAIKQ